MFQRGILPDAVARQNPVLLFDALAEPEPARMDVAEVPDSLRWFYGL